MVWYRQLAALANSKLASSDCCYLQLNLGVKPPRSWHIACTHYPSMGQSEVLLFGGNVHVKPDEKDRVETADLQILSWGRWALIAKG